MLDQATKITRFGETPVFKLICTFSIPCILSMLTSAIYMNVNAIFIAKYIGTNGLSASSIFAPLDIICLLYPSVSLAYGTSTYISYAFGRNQFRIANYYTTMFVCICLVYWVLLTAIMVPLLPKILVMLRAEDIVYRYAYQYGIVAIPGYTFGYTFANAMGPILRAENRANLSMVRQMLGAVLSIVFDAIFFNLAPQMEYYAASVSTCISLLIISIWMILNIFGWIKGGVLRCKFGLLRYSVDELKDANEQQTHQSGPSIETKTVPVLDKSCEALSPLNKHNATIELELARNQQEVCEHAPSRRKRCSSLLFVVWQILTVSFPFYVNGISNSVSSLLAAYHTTSVASGDPNLEIYRSSVGITNTVTTLMSMPITGLVQALTPILGYNLSAGKIDRAYYVLVYTSLIGVVMTLCIWTLCEGLAYQLMFLFAGDSDKERSISAQALRLGLAGLPLQMFVSITVSVSQVKRKTALSTALQVGRALITITCIFLLPAVIKWTGSKVNPINGIFMSPAIGDSISGLISMALYIHWTLCYKRQCNAANSSRIASD